MRILVLVRRHLYIGPAPRVCESFDCRPERWPSSFDEVVCPPVPCHRRWGLLAWKVNSVRHDLVWRFMDGLVRERRNSNALAMELRLSCINPLKSMCIFFIYSHCDVGSWNPSSGKTRNCEVMVLTQFSWNIPTSVSVKSESAKTSTITYCPFDSAVECLYNITWTLVCYNTIFHRGRNLNDPWYKFWDDSRFVPGQWEMALLCNDVSHWPGANLESVRYRRLTDKWKTCITS